MLGVFPRKSQEGIGVVIARSKAHHSGYSTVVYGLELDIAREPMRIYGSPFQLRNAHNLYIWDNSLVRGEGIVWGSIITFRKTSQGNYIYLKNTGHVQDFNTLQFDAKIFYSVKDAFPDAEVSKDRGYLFQRNREPAPNLALIFMNEAKLVDERIIITTGRMDETINLKLNCRAYKQTTAEEQVVPVEEGDMALIKFTTTPLEGDESVYWAVCEGIIAKNKPKIISRSSEVIQIKRGDGTLVQCPGNILFDSGNEAGTGISEYLLKMIENKAPRTPAGFMVQGAGNTPLVQYDTVPITICVRGIFFEVEALVGVPAKGTDLLIGQDVLKNLFDKGYTLGK